MNCGAEFRETRERSPVGRRGDKLGFSLIELLVILVLMAIMTALIIPEMKGTFDEAQLRSTGRELAGALNLAYTQSVTRQETHRVRLDRGGGRYLVEREAREAEQGTGFRPVREIRGGEGELDSRINIEIRKAPESSSGNREEERGFGFANDPRAETPADTISFYPDGTSERVEILLRDRAGFGLALRVNPVTARVKVIAIERREWP